MLFPSKADHFLVWRRVIKQTTIYQGLLFGALFLCMCTLSVLMYEYLYFKRQAERMLEMQEEYKNYLFAVKKVIEEYNTLQEQHNEEKKKELKWISNQDNFVQINRDPQYLKDTTLTFYKDHGIDQVALHSIDRELWQEYDPEIIPHTTPSRSRAARRRPRNSISYRNRKNVRPDTAMTFNKMLEHKKDISFISPVEKNKFWISSFFGPRKNPNGSWGFHQGIDMAALKRTPVKSVAAGIVVEAGERAGFGNTVLITHTNKYRTRYAHLHTIGVKVGQKVEQGELIGSVGDTGLVRSKGKDASHLHFEVHLFGKRVNPMYYLR